MDEELEEWQIVPMLCTVRTVRGRKDLDSANYEWHKRRDSRRRTNPAACPNQGYARSFTRKDKGRKIGFRKSDQ